jgi:GntR family transcriptional regulator/MocR family aminotransferase
MGYLPLRTAIADYLRAARGVRCAPEQVLITSGSQQALDLTARVLLDPGDQAWMEDPGYHGARGALVGAEAEVVPVPVDAEGLDVAAGRRLAPEARLAYVTPSRQLPLGVTMPLARRVELLRWASEVNAWIVEDDYDSEFRFAARPVASLQGIDGSGSVLYAGTFSKVTFPALRLGYLVLPERLVDAFAATRLFMDYHTPYLEQAVMTDFIVEGHFERHIRRTRAVYQERQGALLRAAREHLPGVVQLAPSDGGLTLIGWLDPAFAAAVARGARSPNGHRALGTGGAPGALELPDARICRAAAERGVDVLPLSRFSTRPESLRPGLLFGYAGIRESEMADGMRTMADAIASLGA